MNFKYYIYIYINFVINTVAKLSEDEPNLPTIWPSDHGSPNRASVGSPSALTNRRGMCQEFCAPKELLALCFILNPPQPEKGTQSNERKSEAR